MRERADAQPSVIARSLIAHRHRGGRDGEAVHRRDDYIAKRRITTCCSVRSVTPLPPDLCTSGCYGLFLQRHFALRVLVGGQFLGAGCIAVVAQEKSCQISVGLGSELPGPVRRHQRVDIPKQRRDVA